MSHLIGHIYGSYRLVRLLGEGGYSEVYLARNIHIRHYAAIKLLKTRLTASEAQLFQHEAEIITNLRHQHIIPVHYFDLEHHTPFLIMEYAPHGTLRRRHPPGARVPLERVVSYVKQIADALQYVHEQHLVHRDIKPQNIFLGQHNELLIGDFGIAIITQSTSQQTTQDYRGTACYAAPEQFQGHARPASDQYSLAVLVYEWLTGELPFEGSIMELYYQHLNVPPPPLHEKVPDIPLAVEEVVLKALSKDRHQRYLSIRDFANALEEAYLAVHPHGTGLLTHTHSTVPLPASVRQDVSELPTQPPPHSFLGTPFYVYSGHAGAVRTIAWAPDGKRIASGGDDETVHVWDVATGHTISTYAGHSYWIHSVAWSPEGRHVVSVSGSREVHVTNAATGHKDFILQSSSTLVITVAWSPREALIAGGTNDGLVHLWDAATQDEIFTYRGHSGRVEAVAWSPDGKYIASASSDRTVLVWAARNGTSMLTYRGHAHKVYAVAWSPDGRFLASADMEGMVQVWEALTGRDIASYGKHNGIVYAVSWSDDSKHVASAGQDQTVQIWDASTGETIFTFRDHSSTVHDVTWSPKEKVIASAGDDGTVLVWEAS